MPGNTININITDNVPGQQGDPGRSAYELAVDNGFVGSLSDWLASLQGAAGTGGLVIQEGVIPQEDVSDVSTVPPLKTMAILFDEEFSAVPWVDANPFIDTANIAPESLAGITRVSNVTTSGFDLTVTLAYTSNYPIGFYTGATWRAELATTVDDTPNPPAEAKYVVGGVYQFIDGAVPTDKGVFIKLDVAQAIPLEPNNPYPEITPYLVNVPGGTTPGVETKAVAGDFANVEFLGVAWNNSHPDIVGANPAVDTRTPQNDPPTEYYEFTMNGDGSTPAELKFTFTQPRRFIKAFTAGPNISTLMAVGNCSFENNAGEFTTGQGSPDWGGNTQQADFVNAGTELTVKWYQGALGANYVGQFAIMELYFEGDPTPILVKGLLPYNPQNDAYPSYVYAGTTVVTP